MIIRTRMAGAIEIGASANRDDDSTQGIKIEKVTVRSPDRVGGSITIGMSSIGERGNGTIDIYVRSGDITQKDKVQEILDLIARTLKVK
jgi:hypothetical protein